MKARPHPAPGPPDPARYHRSLAPVAAPRVPVLDFPLRAKVPWILAALFAFSVLTWGVLRARNAEPTPPTRAQAQARLTETGELFSAAIANERDVRPLLAPVVQIAALYPDLQSAHQLAGQIHARLREPEAAYAAFARALELAPANAELQNLAGTAAAMGGDLATAEPHFRRAVAQAPGEARFHLPLGDTLLKTGRLDEAEREFTTTLKLKLMAHEANAGLGDIYAARARATTDAAQRDRLLQHAVDELETALGKLPQATAPPDNPPAALRAAEAARSRAIYVRKLAQNYHLRGDTRESIALLQALPEADRFDPAVLAELARYLDALHQPIVAAVQYEAAAQRAPDNPDLVAAAARWYRQAGDADAAQMMRDRLESRWPAYPALDPK